ncbi:helix-turn-helix transcriptional regulator [Methylotetracoccus oryzae]|uniref:helix-turn-helix transcriptional regulator n=1 Tax=Methylotetracoccus oryzae TaxID=1919059 RepID=UPI001118CCF2|nr:helix-turn-helix transcriptional regulator [Methylotetracoccus oryzae]
MNITEYGKLVRKLRIDAERTTKNMADALGVTPAYLSALETGKKNIPPALVGRVARFFAEAGLPNGNLERELEEAAFMSQRTFEFAPERQDRELIAAFARKFPNMGDEQKRKVLEMLKEFT